MTKKSMIKLSIIGFTLISILVITLITLNYTRPPYKPNESQINAAIHTFQVQAELYRDQVKTAIHTYYNNLFEQATELKIYITDQQIEVTINDDEQQLLSTPIEQADLSLIANFEQLNSLYISFNTELISKISYNQVQQDYIPTLTVPANLKSLESLSIVNDINWGSCYYACSISETPPVVSIPELGTLSNLKSLTIVDCTLDSYQSLSDLKNLNHLRISNANLGDDNLKYIAPLTNLNDLSLVANQIEDVSALSSLTNLTKLSLSYNHIRDVSPLANLTQLEELSLLDNGISDISPLNNLNHLTYLNVGMNSIDNINSLSELSKDTEIHFGDNASNNFTGLNPNNLVGSGTAGTSLGGAPYGDQTLHFTVKTNSESCFYYPINFDGKYITDYTLSSNFEQYITISQSLNDKVCLVPYADTNAVEYYEYPEIIFELTDLDEIQFSGEPVSVIYQFQVI